MASFPPKLHHIFPLLLFFAFIFFIPNANSLKNHENNSTNTMNSHIIGLKSLCKSTPHPNLCFNSLKLSLTLNLPLNLLNILLHSLQNALSEVNKLSSVFATTTHNNLIEKQKGALQDCKELHQISLQVIQKSLSKVKSSSISDAKAYLSAALTNKDTCLEGLASSSGPRKPILVNSIISSYQHVSNSLSMLTHPSGAASPNSMSFVSPPSWFHKSDYDGDGDGCSCVLVPTVDILLMWFTHQVSCYFKVHFCYFVYEFMLHKLAPLNII